MTTLLRKLFWPLLFWFEKGEEEYFYRPMNRTILLALGSIFLLLAALLAWIMPKEVEPGYWAPVAVFGLVGLVGLVVGLLGSNRAVSKIWGNK